MVFMKFSTHDENDQIIDSIINLKKIDCVVPDPSDKKGRCIIWLTGSDLPVKINEPICEVWKKLKGVIE